MENAYEVEVIDMRKQQSVKLAPGEHQLKFHFGTDSYVKSRLQENKTRLGHVYPNPLKAGVSLLNVFTSLPEGSNSIALQLQDIFGRNTILSGTGSYDGGRQAIQWEENFSQLRAGVYLLKIEIFDSVGKTSVHYKKVVFE